jgi:hypothetical protein
MQNLTLSEQMEHQKKQTEEPANFKKLGRTLLYLYAIPFSFWAFDVSTTFYAINVLGIAREQNPLGWPFGVLGALSFYIPALAFTYLLLFKVRNKYSLWVATIVTALALLSGILNLLAGLHNLDVISIRIQW